jgi:N-acyl-phosphatidylethanolamine-hydrolysing phospholipase D
MTRYHNSNRELKIGGFPWYEMVWRGIRGHFTPPPPANGFADFIREWSITPDHQRLAQRHEQPLLTWLGHVSLLLQVAGLNILIDPTLCNFAGPRGQVGARRRVPAPLTPEELPPIDYVLISHNHYDHLDYDTLTRLLRAGQRPRFFVPSGLKPWFDQHGIDQVSEMGWWDRVDLGPITLSFTPAQHWSKRTPFDTNQSHWGGYCIEWQRKKAPWRFLFPGDTGYSNDFKEIRRRLGVMDFVAVPIGAYLPRDIMAPMHVNPDEGVQLFKDLDGQRGLGVHWGTFELSSEAFDQPPHDLLAACRRHQIAPERIWLMKHGESRAIPPQAPSHGD